MENRQHEFNIELDASPDVVWEALTEPGMIVKWFTSEARIEPGVGGKLWLKWFEGMEGDHEILEWIPGKRLTLGSGGHSLVFEIEGRGGKSNLRLVHSGFSADSKFDDEFKATFGGWSTYLAVMQYVLAKKRTEPVTHVAVFRQVEEPRACVWPKVADLAKILALPVTELARPAHGYAVVTVPSLDDSPVAVFCEGFGDKTYVTVLLFLFGRAREQAGILRSRVKTFLESLT